jgi:hypothetical protein
MDYHKKYIKYKNKYNLANKMIGGTSLTDDLMKYLYILHIKYLYILCVKLKYTPVNDEKMLYSIQKDLDVFLKSDLLNEINNYIYAYEPDPIFNKDPILDVSEYDFKKNVDDFLTKFKQNLSSFLTVSIGNFKITHNGTYRYPPEPFEWTIQFKDQIKKKMIGGVLTFDDVKKLFLSSDTEMYTTEYTRPVVTPHPVPSLEDFNKIYNELLTRANSMQGEYHAYKNIGHIFIHIDKKNNIFGSKIQWTLYNEITRSIVWTGNALTYITFLDLYNKL